MKLDANFKRELREVVALQPTTAENNDLTNRVKKCAEALMHRYKFNTAVETYGRAITAYCIAETICANVVEYELSQYAWARAVLEAIGSVPQYIRKRAQINIHPAILMDNSRSLRRLTMEVD